MKSTRLFAIFFVLSVLVAVITVANPVLGAYSVTNTGLTDTQLRATAVPVSGTVTATVASVGATGSAVPASASYCGYSDGTNLRGAVVVDGDSGAGTQYLLGTSGRVVTSGGSVEQAYGTGVRSASTQRVTISTDDIVPASQSVTWTVQPGNTANTTAWKVDGSAVTQPITGSVAHDAVDSGNPVSQGLNAQSAMPTAVAAGDRVRQTGNLYGEARIALPQCTDASTRADVTTTSTTATAAVTAGVLYEVCAEGAPVFWRWAATATLTSGRYLPEGSCRYELSVGTAIAAITRAGGGFLHAVSCVY